MKKYQLVCVLLSLIYQLHVGCVLKILDIIPFSVSRNDFLKIPEIPSAKKSKLQASLLFYTTFPAFISREKIFSGSYLDYCGGSSFHVERGNN